MRACCRQQQAPVITLAAKLRGSFATLAKHNTTKEGKTMATYTDNSGHWHTQYMAKVKTLSNESLRYTIEDCRQAMAAMPENAKWGQYADEVHYCHMEINRRLGK